MRIKIWGAGIAGLSLAAEVSQQIPTAEIVIVDAKKYGEHNRNLSLWWRGDFKFPYIKTWKSIEMADSQGWWSESIHPYQYYVCSEKELLEYFPKQCGKNVHIVNADIDTEEAYDWIFDSRYLTTKPDLVFSGLSCTVILDTPTFSRASVTFFDLKSEDGLPVLYYLLPITQTQAVVERAAMAAQAVKSEEVRIREYVIERFNTSCSIESSHYGKVPVVVKARRSLGGNQIAIGARGGLVKPITGFGVAAILRDSQRIALNLSVGEHPLKGSRTSGLYRWIDATLLEIMQGQPERSISLMAATSRLLTGEGLLRFLDEDMSAAELQELSTRLPAGDFLKNCLKPRVLARLV